ncbi:MAG: hypothetical protein JWO22_2892 [Frankiales bacterium]|nr:hypothetical protein [Frankiales bacterium]
MTESEREERRVAGGGERRTYNRRQPPTVTPPYYEAFERIAVAIEGIGSLLQQRQVRLPDTAGAVPPRASPEQSRGR